MPLVVYSAMLTRGVDPATGCLSDMDTVIGSAAMIGRHNYATQVRRGCGARVRRAFVAPPPTYAPAPLRAVRAGPWACMRTALC